MLYNSGYKHVFIQINKLKHIFMKYKTIPKTVQVMKKKEEKKVCKTDLCFFKRY